MTREEHAGLLKALEVAIRRSKEESEEEGILEKWGDGITLRIDVTDSTVPESELWELCVYYVKKSARNKPWPAMIKASP